MRCRIKQPKRENAAVCSRLEVNAFCSPWISPCLFLYYYGESRIPLRGLKFRHFVRNFWPWYFCVVRYGTVEHSLEFTLVFKHLYRWLKAFGFASFNNSLLYFLDFADQTTFLCYCNITDILTIIIYLHYFLSVRSLDITPTIYIFCLYAKNFKLAKIPAKKTFLYKHPTLCFKKLKKKTEKILSNVRPFNYTTDNI